jgi:hypothetical protein
VIGAVRIRVSSSFHLARQFFHGEAVFQARKYRHTEDREDKACGNDRSLAGNFKDVQVNQAKRKHGEGHSESDYFFSERMGQPIS